jgi:cell division septal protein FtsQ
MKRDENRYRRDRPEKEPSRKRRRAGMAVLCVSALAGLILLSSALARGYYALQESSLLSLDEVQVHGLNRVEGPQVLEALGVPRGASLLSMPLRRMKDGVESLDWVAAANVRIDARGRLVVNVSERRPAARIRCQSGSCLVDGNGELFLETDSEEFGKLPVLEGAVEFDGGARKALAPGARRLFPELLRALDGAPEPIDRDRALAYRWDGGTRGFEVVMRVYDKEILVRLGTSDFDSRLDRLDRVLELLRSRNGSERAFAVDLDFSRRAFVRPVPGGFKDI